MHKLYFTHVHGFNIYSLQSYILKQENVISATAFVQWPFSWYVQGFYAALRGQGAFPLTPVRKGREADVQEWHLWERWSLAVSDCRSRRPIYASAFPDIGKNRDTNAVFTNYLSDKSFTKNSINSQIVNP